MKLWERASALLKDRNSIYLARLSRKTSCCNPEIEEAVIKATSHDETSVDYKNAQRIFTWIRTSSKFIKPVIWALSTRMDKTRSWIVALKGLLLMHGIFCCKIPVVQRIGRLPFDFSNFIDGYSNSPRVWGFNAFIRAYFAFLDQKSAAGVFEGEGGDKRRESFLTDTLEELRKSQALLDMLLQVKPYSDGWHHVLILEAMDCIVIEIFDVYSKICNGIARVLVRIYTAGQEEAEKALHVLHKATAQGDELDSYFEFCRDIGVLNASEFPRVEKIPEEDIRDLERIIYEISKEKNNDRSLITQKESYIEQKESQTMETLKEDSMKLSRTIITDNWVVFDDEFKVEEEQQTGVSAASTNFVDPFAASVNVPPLLCSSDNDFTNSNGSLQMQQYCSSPLLLTDGDQRSDSLLQPQQYYNSLHGALSNGGDQRSNGLSQPQQQYFNSSQGALSTGRDQDLLQPQQYYSPVQGTLSNGAHQRSIDLLQPQQQYYNSWQGALSTGRDQSLLQPQQYYSFLQGALLSAGGDQRSSSLMQTQQYYSPMQGALSTGGDQRANAMLQMQQYYGSMQGALSTGGNQRNLILSL